MIRKGDYNDLTKSLHNVKKQRKQKKGNLSKKKKQHFKKSGSVLVTKVTKKRLINKTIYRVSHKIHFV